MNLTPSQQDALNIEKHVCVTAGAGSGKTTVLVERYLKILCEGNATPREIVAITFTDKAAAEMKDRVIERLSAQAGNEDSAESNSLQHFRDEMNSAYISTIHAFCSSILREFPFQAGVPANFSILQGIDQKLSLQDTVKKTLKTIAINAEDEHRPELTRLLQRY
ncbi:AAA family ATPase, partial [Candidatus Poribacteria bacterium]|nr:AAA family ATPase [Candidatus Poribacteria bacterium]